MTESQPSRPWHHAPPHRFVADRAYMLTAGTYLKEPFFGTPELKTVLLETIFSEAARFGWSLQAWAVLSNHYHLVALSPGTEEGAKTLTAFLRSVHSRTAIAANRAAGSPGRRVWHQYWDTCLTNERSYFARLRYVHENPQRHGVVGLAENYPWCSMRWFQSEAEPGYRKTVLAFPCDRIKVRDDF